MKPRGLERIKAKLTARLWLLGAIQSCSSYTDKSTQSEIKRFIRRIQRDIKSLERAQVEFEKSRKREVAKLLESQRDDAKDRKIRFERAIE